MKIKLRSGKEFEIERLTWIDRKKAYNLLPKSLKPEDVLNAPMEFYETCINGGCKIEDINTLALDEIIDLGFHIWNYSNLTETDKKK